MIHITQNNTQIPETIQQTQPMERKFHHITQNNTQISETIQQTRSMESNFHQLTQRCGRQHGLPKLYGTSMGKKHFELGLSLPISCDKNITSVIYASSDVRVFSQTLVYSHQLQATNIALWVVQMQPGPWPMRTFQRPLEAMVTM